MSMVVEWSCADMTGAASGAGATETYQLSMHVAGRIALSDAAGNQEVLGVRERVHELYRVGGWLAEVSYSESGSLVLLLKPCPRAQRIELVFQEGQARLVRAVAWGCEEQVRRFALVERVSFEAGRGISVTCGSDLDPLPVRSAATPTPAPVPAGQVEELHQELERERQARAAQELRATRAEERAVQLQARLDEAQARARQAEAQLGDERQRTAGLQTLAQTHLEELCAQAQQAREAADASLRQLVDDTAALLAQAEDLAAQAAEQRERKQALEAQVAQLQEERAQLERQADELESLDCAQAQAGVDELRLRFAANEQTAELMRGDPFLTGNSVRRTLGNVGDELAAAERRIGLIVSYREAYLGAVQQSINVLGGQLPLAQELERGYEGDGDGEEPAAQDQGA